MEHGMNNKLLMQLAATAELCGSPLSQPAIELLAEDLAGEPEGAVYAALSACRMSHRGRLTAEAITSRLPDGHLPADEAWALAIQAMDENETVVWTQPIAEAWGAAKLIMQSGDEVGARMAFRSAYERRIAAARADGLRPKWFPSLGHDPAKRAAALDAAADRLRLPHLAERAAIEDQSRQPASGHAVAWIAQARRVMSLQAPRPGSEVPLDELVAALPEDRDARRKALAEMAPSQEHRVRHVLGEAEKKRQLEALYRLMTPEQRAEHDRGAA
jgi:hypothetical protein